jgi:hypothetical protein
MKVIALFVLAGFCSLPFNLFAGWQFDKRLSITGESIEGIYHHLDGAGRKHIAVSGDKVAVLWEDDSSGNSQIYLAIKNSTAPGFESVAIVSNGEEAYEPAIASLPGGRFALVWEQDGAVYLNTWDGKLSNKQLKLSSDLVASQSSLATSYGQIYVVWREQQGGTWRLKVAELSIARKQVVELRSIESVGSKTINTPVLFPTLAANESGLYLAWEDRSAGHTRLKFSFSSDPAQGFVEPEYLNEFYSNRTEYDKGNGVTRVSLASFGEDEIVSAWMDKRRSGGYGIFSAIGSDGAFGPNEKIHGPVGDKLPHYNPATSGNTDGAMVVAWDDYRTGDSDIWLTSFDESGEWGENFSPAVASGPGEQSHASIALGESGGLHLVWIERETPMAPTRLWYSFGKPDPAIE